MYKIAASSSSKPVAGFSQVLNSKRKSGINKKPAFPGEISVFITRGNLICKDNEFKGGNEAVQPLPEGLNMPGNVLQL
jgi:hypothetical protein